MPLIPARGVLICKPIETEESLPGCLIVLTQNARAQWAQWQMEVVGVGRPDICAKPRKCLRQQPHGWRAMRGRGGVMEWYGVHTPDRRLKAGAWVLVAPRSPVRLSMDQNLYAVRQDQVLAVFDER